VKVPILNLQGAWSCNGMEKNQTPVTATGQGFEFPVKPFEIVTIRIEGAPALKMP
jgi:hypothetical protein